MTQKELTELLANASCAYYNGQTPLMSDLEFDKKLEELRKMEAESGVVLPGSPTVNVGAKVDGLKTVRHEQPALSLDKVKYANRMDLVKWLGDKEGVVSWKMDGLTLVLTYDDGKLTLAATRGDGIEGKDVTHNARFFKGIPQEIEYKGHLVVRGEAIMTYKEFERVNAEAGGIYENPRNLAAATVQMLDANESRKREIEFYAFELVSPEPNVGTIQYESLLPFQPDRGPLEKYTASEDISTYEGRMWTLSSLGFQTVSCGFGVNSWEIDEVIGRWEEDLHEHAGLSFPTDGLVITYNDLVYGWGLGMTGHHPRWAIALKWTDETETTTIRNVEWSVGKTGLITPVAVFDPVRLGAGSTITRASLHNISIMEKLKVKVHAKTKVYLANMIIPQITMCEERGNTFADVMVDDIVIATDEYTHDYNEHLVKIASIETDKEAVTETNPYGYVLYGSDLDGEDEEDAVNAVYESNFIGIAGIQIPKICPCCGEPTAIRENNGVKTLFCENPSCSAKQVAALINTFSKDGLFVKGLGESQIEDLMRNGIVDATPQSFYDIAHRWKEFEANPHRNESEPGYLVIKNLLAKDGWGIRKWNNLMDAIDASRKTTLQKFLYSLNIPLLGNDLSKKLSKFWHNDIEEFISFVSEVAVQTGKDDRSVIKKALDTLTEIEGVGEEKARNIVWWAYNLPDNDGLKNLLALRKELNFPEVKDSATADNSLEGLTFVVTGAVFDYKNRDEFKASVEARGGKVAGSVSAKTSYLVNNDVNSTSGKNAKAKELNIPIISEDEFISRFGK